MDLGLERQPARWYCFYFALCKSFEFPKVRDDQYRRGMWNQCNPRSVETESGRICTYKLILQPKNGVSKITLRGQFGDAENISAVDRSYRSHIRRTYSSWADTNTVRGQKSCIASLSNAKLGLQTIINSMLEAQISVASIVYSTNLAKTLPQDIYPKIPQTGGLQLHAHPKLRGEKNSSSTTCWHQAGPHSTFSYFLSTTRVLNFGDNDLAPKSRYGQDFGILSVMMLCRCSNRNICPHQLRTNGCNPSHAQRNPPIHRRLSWTVSSNPDIQFLKLDEIDLHDDELIGQMDCPDYTNGDCLEMLRKIRVEHIDFAHTILALVLYAARPLTESEIIDAVSNDKFLGQGCVFQHSRLSHIDIISLCGGLLHTGPESAIAFIHPAVNTVLTSPSCMEVIPKEFRFDLSKALERFAWISLTHLLLVESELSQDAPTTTISGFTEYATQFWMIHYQMAEARSHTLTALLQRFLEYSLGRFQIWEQNYNNLVQPKPHLCQESPLQICARFGFLGMVQVYLEMGVPINDRKSFTPKNPLFLAINNCQWDVAELFLHKGALIHAPDARISCYMLETCILNERSEISRLLLQCGVTYQHIVGDESLGLSQTSILEHANNILDHIVAEKCRVGEADKAIELCMSVLIGPGDSSDFHPEHDKMVYLSAFNCVARAFQLQDSSDSAIEWYSHSLKKHIQWLGMSDPATVNIVKRIAAILSDGAAHTLQEPSWKT